MNKGLLYKKLENAFNITLKKYIFKDKINPTNSNKIKSLALELLSKSEDFYAYKAVFQEIGNENTFKKLNREINKTKYDSDLFIELQDKVFESLNKIKPDKNMYLQVKNRCNVDFIRNITCFIISNNAFIWDDS
ncbi:MAG: hypothetical protein LKG27_02380 [Clostridiaceae bacterium]|jgi:hypothetical protein|nr:hypothetical protein [Clostridiaceae bacterium]